MVDALAARRASSVSHRRSSARAFLGAASATCILAAACGGTPAVDGAPPVSADAHRASAVSLLAATCAGGDECFRLGRQARDAGQMDAARDAFRKSCRAEPFHPEGCAWFVRLVLREHPDFSALEGPGFDRAEEISSAAHNACFQWPNAPSGSDGLRSEACMVLAESLTQNTRLLNRSGAGWTPYLAYSNACSFGGDAACEAMHKETVRPPSARSATTNEAKVAAPDARREEPPSDVEGANLHLTGMNVDGVSLDDIACKLRDSDASGIFGGMVIGAGFKAKKAALDACSKGAIVRTRVRWTGQGGRMTKLKAAGKDAATSRCVEEALSGAVSTVSGNCAATVVHGRN